MTKDYRIRNGQRQVRCGGYVGWDGRQKDQHDYPLRRRAEVYVWMPADADYSDCGPATASLTRALEEALKRRKRFKTDRHVECRECWG